MNHMQHLQDAGPSWYELWNPWVLVAAILLTVMYFWVCGRGGRRFAGYAPVSGRMKFYFVSGMLVFWGAEGTPIRYYGHMDLFSAHMLEQSMMYLILPPLVYLSLPAWLVRPVLGKRWAKLVLYPFTQPFVAILSFNLLFSIYHIPTIFNYLYGVESFHLSYHLLLLAAAFQMWFPVFCPLPEWNRLSDLQRMTYIFSNGVLLTPACALIIFAKHLLFDPYVDAPVLISWVHGLHDQQLGGVIMKILQEIVYGIVLAYSFMKWYRRERREEDYPGDPNSPSERASRAAAAKREGTDEGEQDAALLPGRPAFPHS